MLLEGIRETLSKHAMLMHGERVLVGVSGGVDSVVLMHALHGLAPELGFALCVAHLNHGWRGEDSDGDEAFVRSLAAEMKLEYVTERLDDGEAAIHRGAGREGAAREVRRRFLLEAAEQLSASRIATGHTKNDRAETILLNLTRGTGSAGLSGIDPIAGPFIRPMIALRREDILAYARSEGLTWREDASNEDVTFSRNRIRHEVLPQLQQINPQIVEALCRAGDHAFDALAIERILAERLWPEVTISEEPEEIRFRRAVLSELPHAVQTMLLRDALRRTRGDLDGVERSHILSVVAGLEVSGHSEHQLPRGHIRIDGNSIRVSATPFGDVPPWELPVQMGRTRVFDSEYEISLSILDRHLDTEDAARRDRTIEVADADRIKPPLTLRNRRVGDRFTPLGMTQPVKMKDFLMNARVPFFSRDQVPLLCDQEKIIWVVGVRLSDDVRITSSTERILEMRLEPTT